MGGAGSPELLTRGRRESGGLLAPHELSVFFELPVRSIAAPCRLESDGNTVTPSHPTSPESLVEHADGLRRLARALMRDKSAAEDVVQDALVTALQRSPSKPAALRAWLRQIVRRKAIDHDVARLRRGQREQATARPEAVCCHLETAEKLAVRRAVVEAVEALPLHYSAVVSLRYFDGLPPREIAARLQLPVKTVKTQLWRGLELLRQHFDAKYSERRAWAVLLLPLVHPLPMSAASASAAVTGAIAMKLKIAIASAGLLLLCIPLVSVLLDGPDAPSSLSTNRGRESAAEEAESTSGPAGVVTSERIATRPFAVPATPDLPNRRVLRGRVVTASGDAVPGARVLVTERIARLELGMFADWEATPGELRVITEGLAEEDGVFALVSEKVPGFVSVVAVARGFLATRVDLSEPSLDDVTNVGDIVLQRGLLVQGVVEDPRGKPVGNAHIRAWRGSQVGGRAVMFDRELQGGVRSRPDGSFELVATRVSDVVVRAAHPDYLTAEVQRSVASGQNGAAGIVLRLGEALEIRGSVSGYELLRRDAVLRVAAAEILSREVTSEAAVETGGVVQVPVRDDGSFRIAGLAPQKRYRLHLVELEARAPQHTARASRARFHGPGDRDVVLTYEPGVLLTFRALDAQTGAAVSQVLASYGTTVSFDPESDEEWQELEWNDTFDAHKQVP